MKKHRYAKLFPPMQPAEYEALKASIAVNGLRVPMLTYKGELVDGVHRERACQETGQTPRYTEWDEQGSLLQLVIDLNRNRRDLTADQRKHLAVEIEAELAKEAKERQREAGKEGGKRSGETRRKQSKVPANLPEPSDEPKQPTKKDHSGEAREQAAAAMDVSPRGVQEAKKIKAVAPELSEKVKNGEMTHAQAMREVRTKERMEELEAKAAAAELASNGEQTWEVRTGDCIEELQTVEAGSVRLVFADPPYNIGIDYGEGTKADRLPDEQYLEWVRDWVRFCKQSLTPDGSLWVLIGDEYAAEYAVTLKRLGFTIRSWIKWFESFGVNCNNNFNRCSRHLFYCVNDPEHFIFNAGAVNRSSDRQTKYDDARADPGGKIWDDVWGITPPIPRIPGTAKERIPEFPTQLPLDLLRAVVGCASDPGDLVVDPFNGSGTTGVAATQLGRRYLGIEKSEQFAALATKRLLAEQVRDNDGGKTT